MATRLVFEVMIDCDCLPGDNRLSHARIASELRAIAALVEEGGPHETRIMSGGEMLGKWGFSHLTWEALRSNGFFPGDNYKWLDEEPMPDHLDENSPRAEKERVAGACFEAAIENVVLAALGAGNHMAAGVQFWLDHRGVTIETRLIVAAIRSMRKQGLLKKMDES